MKHSKEPIKIYLTGSKANTYSIVGLAKDALRKAGKPENVVQEYYDKALEVDYKTLIDITKEYVGEYIEFVE